PRRAPGNDPGERLDAVLAGELVRMHQPGRYASRGVRMPQGKLGVAARDLSDQALKRQLRTMWQTRSETVLTGGSHALAAHTHRMLELEYEYISRFEQETAPNPARTRRGSRARSGQPPGRR